MVAFSSQCLSARHEAHREAGDESAPPPPPAGVGRRCIEGEIDVDVRIRLAPELSVPALRNAMAAMKGKAMATASTSTEKAAPSAATDSRRSASLARGGAAAATGSCGGVPAAMPPSSRSDATAAQAPEARLVVRGLIHRHPDLVKRREQVDDRRGVFRIEVPVGSSR